MGGQNQLLVEYASPPQFYATSMFLLALGSYTSAQSLAITDFTRSGQVLHRERSGPPSTTKFPGPIVIASTETSKANVAATACTNSAIGTAAYTLG